MKRYTVTAGIAWPQHTWEAREYVINAEDEDTAQEIVLLLCRYIEGVESVWIHDLDEVQEDLTSCPDTAI